MVSKKIDLDYILVNELGQFGKYQAFTAFLVAFPVLFSAFGQDYIFTASAIPTRCQIAECEAANPEYAPNWILRAVPGQSVTNFDNCKRYAVASNIHVYNQTSTSCPVDFFNRSATIGCDYYVYERTNSIVYDFGIECQEWKRTLVGTLNSIGTLLVLPIAGYLSDRFGRKNTLIICAMNACIVGFIRSFSVNYYMFAGLHLLQTTIGSGAYSSGFIIGTELVGPKYRVMFGICCSTIFAIGQTVLGLTAWAIPEWRDLTLVLYTPSLALLVPYFWILNESIRWMISKKKYIGAEAVLKKVAKMNNKKLSDTSLQALFADAEFSENKSQRANEHSLFKQVVRSSVMLKRVCTTPIWWVTATLTYYGLSINSTGLIGNMYLNYILVCLIEIPGYWTAFFLLNKVGRRLPLFMGFIICSICQICFILIRSDKSTMSLLVYLIGKYSISLVFTTIYIYTAELYPTVYRHSFLAFSSMIGRIGAIVAPLTPALMVYWSGLPSLIFAIFGFTSAILVISCPETLNLQLPETMEDAINIGRKKPEEA